LMAKRVLDHLALAVSSGAPSIHHSRASSVEVNLRKETPAYPVNEVLWRAVSETRLQGDDPAACYAELADGLAMDGDYWATLKRAMRIWSELFQSSPWVDGNRGTEHQIVGIGSGAPSAVRKVGRV